MSPRILLLDIETAPSLGFYWDPWKEGNIIHVERDWYVLCYAYKWLGEKGVKVRALPDYPRYEKDGGDDYDLLQDLWKLLDEAQIVVAHNGDRFDIPKVTARLVGRFKPPSPFKTVDTLKLAKRHKFESNRLDALARYFGVGSKLPHTGTHMWLGCINRDPKAWGQMKKYNAHDVVLLEEVYHKLKGWGGHQNLSYLTREHSCPTCQSSKLQHRGWTYLKASKRRRLQCQDCGAWSSGAETIAIPKV